MRRLKLVDKMCGNFIDKDKLNIVKRVSFVPPLPNDDVEKDKDIIFPKLAGVLAFEFEKEGLVHLRTKGSFKNYGLFLSGDESQWEIIKDELQGLVLINKKK